MITKNKNREATADQAGHSLTIIHQQGLNFEQYKVLHNGYLAAVAQAAKHGAMPPLGEFRRFLKLRARVIDLGRGVSMTEPVILTIDYRRSWAEMKASAGFDETNRDKEITPERFPVTSPVGVSIVQVEASLFNFPGGWSSGHIKDVIVRADGVRPWQLAHTEHIFAYAEKFPNEQLEYPIVGLGSTARVDGDRRVLCLDGYGSERGLYLGWFGDGWGGDYRFLAVRIAL